jgi:hypothetical protein
MRGSTEAASGYSQVMPDSFSILGLGPKANQKEIVDAVIKKIKSDPHAMKKIAELQSSLLNPGKRFLIELLYYPDFESVFR